MSAEESRSGLHALAGQVPDVQCRDVLEEVYLYLDGEVTPEERVAIRLHLDDCGPCLRKFGIEQEVKALVARCCGQEQTPSHLRERVLSTLRSVVISDDGTTLSVTTTTVVTETELI
jgi:mycothiol system anti-sigma-R factor